MIQQPSLPFKNVAIALLFTLFLGPIGLLYASFWGGISMIILSLILIGRLAVLLLALLWIVCCVWSVAAAEKHNRDILEKALKQP